MARVSEKDECQPAKRTFELGESSSEGVADRSGSLDTRCSEEFWCCVVWRCEKKLFAWNLNFCVLALYWAVKFWKTDFVCLYFFCHCCLTMRYIALLLFWVFDEWIIADDVVYIIFFLLILDVLDWLFIAVSHSRWLAYILQTQGKHEVLDWAFFESKFLLTELLFYFFLVFRE